MSPDSTDNKILFQRYLEICNKALENNKNRFPYKEILKALEGLQEDENIKVCIIDDHPQAELIMKRHNDSVTAIPCSKKLRALNAKRWNVTKSYLEDVTKNPEMYIENPALINWDWISE